MANGWISQFLPIVTEPPPHTRMSARGEIQELGWTPIGCPRNRIASPNRRSAMTRRLRSLHATVLAGFPSWRVRYVSSASKSFTRPSISSGRLRMRQSLWHAGMNGAR